jgi:hypothetical protein
MIVPIASGEVTVIRNQTPFQWIEEAEARTVLASAMFEQAAPPSWWCRAQQDASQWLYRVRLWCAAGSQISSPRLQVEPALIRRPTDPRGRRQAADNSYSCRW